MTLTKPLRISTKLLTTKCRYIRQKCIIDIKKHIKCSCYHNYQSKCPDQVCDFASEVLIFLATKFHVCFPCFEFQWSPYTQKKQQKHLHRRKSYNSVNVYNPGCALTGFRRILSCFQQVNQTWPHDPIEKPAPGQWSTSKNTWPRWAVNLSPRYGHVILVSRYLVLTGVSWS